MTNTDIFKQVAEYLKEAGNDIEERNCRRLLIAHLLENYDGKILELKLLNLIKN